jgi:capsular exopolysaccharide synthesis family protein
MDDPLSLPADSCRAIRTAVDCHNLDRPLRTLLITSPGAHEGKSTVLLNLALAFVESGRRVLMIDADLRRPSLHRALGVSNEGGLADMLQREEVWPEGFRGISPGLEFLPSGTKIQNPGSLLSSRHMAALLEKARERADVVLIDCPPVLAVSDCLPLTSQVDGVLMVIRFGVTQRRSVIRAKQLLDKVSAGLVGVVVNGLSPRETRKHYAEYTHYVGAAKPARKKKRRSMKSLFMGLLIGLNVLGAGAAVEAAEEEYKIGTEDVLHVIVWDNKELEQTVMVRPDGRISYPLAGEIQVQGLTIPQLTEILKERLATSVKNPNVSVMVKEIRSFRVHFVGRIQKPGVYPIKSGTPLLQALTLAGGTSEGADLSAAYIIRGDRKVPIDLRKLIQEGDLSRNVRLEREDTIVVPEISVGSNPQEMQERRIYLLGKVVKPGVYTLKQDVPCSTRSSLPAAPPRAGHGLGVHHSRRRANPVDLWKLIQKGDTSQNVLVKHEDTVSFPRAASCRTPSMSWARSPSRRLRPARSAHPAEARDTRRRIHEVRGPGRATLIRRDGEQKVLMKVDLKDIMNDPRANEDLALRPGDVLIVPERLF